MSGSWLPMARQRYVRSKLETTLVDLLTSIHQSVYHVLVYPLCFLQARDERLVPPVFSRGWRTDGECGPLDGYRCNE